MRDLIILVILLYGTLRAFTHPYIGMLTWTWVSIMNPHRMGWHLSSYPVAAIVGGATLIGLFVTRDKRYFFMTPPSLFLLLFSLWMCITYLFSFYPDECTFMLSRVMKINFMIFVAMMVLYTRQHIIALVWVLVFSIGFYGAKGGAFTIATGGSYRVWGPPGSFIEGNNEVALAMIMVIPLMYFLRSLYHQVWVRRALLAAMFLTAASALGSQSRGALLALVAMALLFWWRLDAVDVHAGKKVGNQRAMLGALIVLAGVAFTLFMPESWHQRMDTIGTYQQDASAMGRINAWHMAWNLASHNFFGGGYSIYNHEIFMLYAPDPDDVHAAHSIYFQVLGEHGFIGLILFLLVWWFTWRCAGWLRVNAGHDDETRWASVLGSMVQASLAGYAVGGAFLSLAYFDLPYNLMVLVVLARRWVEHQQAGTSLDEAPQPTGKRVRKRESFRARRERLAQQADGLASGAVATSRAAPATPPASR